MIRPILLLFLTPFITACDLNDLISPGASSKAAYEYRASIMATEAPAAPETPQPIQVAEIPVPAAVDVPEPVYVAPEPPAPYVPPSPTCTPLHRIIACGPNGETILLET